MYRNFFIHSSVDGHLGCFQVLAIIISAVMNIGVHVPFQLWFLRVYAQLWELLDYMVVLFLVFKGITVLFFIVAVSVHMPTSSARSTLIYCL